MTQATCGFHIRVQQTLASCSHDSVAGESGTGPRAAFLPTTHWSSSVLTALVLAEPQQLHALSQGPSSNLAARGKTAHCAQSMTLLNKLTQC